jgi:2-dehydropantoate 2-reductase
VTLSVAVLGPGGVGGLLAGALDRAEQRVVVVAREPTADLIAQRGLRVDSVRLGRFVARPRTVARLREPVDALIVATKATGLEAALERIDAPPALVLPLLNGLDHLAVLREHFSGSDSASASAAREGEPRMRGGDPVVAGAIRVESDRPEPGVIVHTSPFLRVDMASRDPGRRAALAALARRLEDAGVPVRVLDSEPQVMWSKLVRLTALACTTSAFDLPLGDIPRAARRARRRGA